MPSPFETRDPVKDVWGPRTPIALDEDWPVRVDQHRAPFVDEPDKWVQSACVLCSNGCGCDIGVKDGRIVGIRGRAVDRVNKGRLGPKGMLTPTVGRHDDRLLYPLIRKEGKLVRASWEEAMGLIVSKSKETIETLTEHAMAFYTSGQLMLEEYHTLAVIGKGGLGTLHMDGNTRLCTATAAASMRESFGCDGQPGSYTDIERTTAIMLVGHNMASTQTVLWARILDRLDGPNPPKVVAIDPRATAVAQRATVHLAPRPGTNQAVLNGLLYLLFENDWVDREYIKAHTVGIDDLEGVVREYPPERVEELSGVPASDLRRAARVIGEAEKLLSTALQGVYQAPQATAAACQINNIQLVRGMIGKPGCGVLQMNGQPTAQNNRECGCDGEYPGFRNWQNPEHIADLAKHWNVPEARLAHHGLPTHVHDIIKFIEDGSITMLWISGTNPAVSLPNLQRIKKLLTSEQVFVIAQDIFPTETTDLADVVLPAAMWGEKTGCFTNVDRTVHISHQAVPPPGECRSDLDIWLDYAERMDFKNTDDQPLIPWKTAEEAFDHWKATTAGRPCDYTGLSYEKLSRGSGIQWPCNDQYPDGCERLYADGVFPTDIDHAESWGHDHETGATLSKAEYMALNPAGRAILKAAHYDPAGNLHPTDKEYPLQLITGRMTLHFHTRSKTGRSDRLAEGAGGPFVELSAADAEALGLTDGEEVVVESRTGRCVLPCKVDSSPTPRGVKGVVFLPFHFGSKRLNKVDGRGKGGGAAKSAANELTPSAWDPISKQPYLKSGAVRVSRASEASDIPSNIEASAPARQVRRSRQLEVFLGLWDTSAHEALEVLELVQARHPGEYEVVSGADVAKTLIRRAISTMAPSTKKYGMRQEDSGQADGGKAGADDHLKNDTLINAIFHTSRASLGAKEYHVLMSLQGVVIFLTRLETDLLALSPTANALHDKDFVQAVQDATKEVGRASAWAKTLITPLAPQALIVPALDRA